MEPQRTPAAPWEDRGEGTSQGPGGAGDRTVFHLIDVPDVRTVQVRIAGSPHSHLARGEALAPVLGEFLDDPSRAAARFEEWIAAGADILVAPTHCATPSCLKPLGLGARAMELNRAQVEALRRAAGRASPSPWVAAQVGSLGADWGDGFFAFDEAYIQYHEQAKALALVAPDLVVVRGIRDLRILRAALVAVRELWSGLLMVLLDPDAVRGALVPAGGREEADFLAGADVVASLGVSAIGFEGDLGTARVEALSRKLQERGFSALGSVLPSGEAPLQAMASLARAGVGMALLEGERGLQALRQLSSRAETFPAPDVGGTPGWMPRPEPAAAGQAEPSPGEPSRRDLLLALEVDSVDEPAGRKSAPIADPGPAIPPGQAAFSAVRILSPSEKMASEGVRRRRLEERLAALEKEEGRPLALLVRDPLVLETGLKAARGRSIAYLDSLDASLWPSVLYLVARHGARLAVRLPFTRARPGQPSGGGCLPAIVRLLDAAREYRLPASDLYVDPIGFDEAGAATWDRPAVDAVLRGMPWIKRETGVRWILACHHFRPECSAGPVPGLAAQSEVLSIALFQGLDAVILGPDQGHLIEVLNEHL